MRRLKLRKKAFTLAETMIVCTIFAMMVVGIILGINRAFVFMNNTKLDVIATNLAREGVEMMYNIRDTNWRKFSGERDVHVWYNFGGGSEENGTTPWPKKITETLDYNGSREFGLDGIANNHLEYCGSFLTGVYDNVGDFFDFIDGDNNDLYGLLHKYAVAGCGIEAAKYLSREFSGAKLGFAGIYSYFSSGHLATGEINDLFNVGDAEFYRVVRLYGVYEKNGVEPSKLCQGATCLTNSDPKERRFCVKVFYRNPWGKHAKELCSIMTNFME